MSRRRRPNNGPSGIGAIRSARDARTDLSEDPARRKRTRGHGDRESRRLDEIARWLVSDEK